MVVGNVITHLDNDDSITEIPNTGMTPFTGILNEVKHFRMQITFKTVGMKADYLTLII